MKGKCIDFLSDGITPCPYSKKFGDVCGIHHNKRNRLKLASKNEIEDQSETEEDQSETEVDDYETKATKYFLNFGDCFKVGIESTFDKLIIEKEENTSYTVKDLEYEYRLNTVLGNNIADFKIDNIPRLFKYKNKGQLKNRYAITIRYNGNDLIFLPVFKNDDILTFVCVSFEKFSSVNELHITESDNGYPQSQKTSLHEIIRGKKAEKQGWYLIEKNDPDSNIDAIWITMTSGRSADAYDPDPSKKDFYYYHNPENGFNIKIPNPEFFIEGFENLPKIKEGNHGDFYKDKNGSIYIKIDDHYIDHIDSVPQDARTHKLREILKYANAINKIKKKNVYVGVSKERDLYVGEMLYKGKKYRKSFKTKIEAARFYDYHALSLHGVYVRNNNTIDPEEQKELFLYGIEKIPSHYRVVEKEKNEFPGITFSKDRNKYRLKRNFKSLFVCCFCDTFEEAYELWIKFEDDIEKLKEAERKETLENNKDNFDSTHGYLIVKNGETQIEHKIKLNIEVYLEFVHCNWWFNRGKPCGTYKGKTQDLHLHVMEFYNEDYNKREYGTVDHRYQDHLDCTIETLRPASASLQAQNIKRWNSLGYKGVSIKENSFIAKYKNKNLGSFEYLEDAARAYNKAVDEEFGKDTSGKSNGLINIVPDNIKTSVKDLYSNENLTLETLQNITLTGLRSLIFVNEKVRNNLNIDYLPTRELNKEINKENFEDIRNKIIGLLS